MKNPDDQLPLGLVIIDDDHVLFSAQPLGIGRALIRHVGMISHSSHSTVKSHKAESAYFLSKQILSFGFAERYSTDRHFYKDQAGLGNQHRSLHSGH